MARLAHRHDCTFDERWDSSPTSWRPRESRWEVWIRRSDFACPALRRVIEDDLSALLNRNALLELKYSERLDGFDSEDLDREIGRLEEEAAAIIESRASASLDPLDQRLDRLLEAAQELLGNGKAASGDD